jgi:Uma2 family endonuclease
MHGLARAHGLGEVVGPVTVHVHDEMVFEPDLAFIRADRMHIVDPEGDVHGVPDLVVEVLSPSNRSYDRGLKRKHYHESGVPEVWLVDIAARSIDIWRAGSSAAERVEDTATWRVGERTFEIPLAEVFRGI